MSNNEQAGEAVPAAQRGSWTTFVKSIASVSGDLSSLTAPPFILSPVSLTEFPAYWCEHPDLFSKIADAKGGEERILAVLRWFISTLKGQYTSRNESMGSEKKPLNPVLGELFYGTWPDINGRGQTNLLVEQVSHHPPITAYVIENKQKGLRLVGHNAQKTSFSAGAIIVKQIGHAVLTYTPPSTSSTPPKPETYLLTLPRLRIDGIWYGSPYIELCETSWISGGGYVCTIDYKGKGYFSGKSHSFKATVVPNPSAACDPSGKGVPIGGGNGGSGGEYVIDGTWHTTSKISKGKGAGTMFHNVEDGPYGKKEEVSVKGVGGMGAEGGMEEFETRRLWAAVAKGIRTGDFDTASKEKSAIENDQRQRRRDEQAAGTKWPMKHFQPLASDPVYQSLGRHFNAAPPTEDCYVFQENWPAGKYE